MLRGHRPVEYFKGEQRVVLEALRKELYNLCDEYKFEKPAFLVSVSKKVGRHGQIRYNKFTRFCQCISVTTHHLSSLYMNGLLNTIKHEFAHLYTLKKYGYVNHGPGWQSFHKSIGGDGKRATEYKPDKTPYHIDLPVPYEEVLPRIVEYAVAADKPEPKFIYKCKCGREFQRFAKISQAGMNKGFCPSCHTYMFQMELTELE